MTWHPKIGEKVRHAAHISSENPNGEGVIVSLMADMAAVDFGDGPEVVCIAGLKPVVSIVIKSLRKGKTSEKTTRWMSAMSGFIRTHGPTRVRITSPELVGFLQQEYPDLLDNGRVPSSATAVLGSLVEMGIIRKDESGYRHVDGKFFENVASGKVADILREKEGALILDVETWLKLASTFPTEDKENWSDYPTADGLYPPGVDARFRQYSHVAIERWMTNVLGLPTCNSIVNLLIEAERVNLARETGKLDISDELCYVVKDRTGLPADVVALDGRSADAPYESIPQFVGARKQGIKLRERVLSALEAHCDFKR